MYFIVMDAFYTTALPDKAVPSSEVMSSDADVDTDEEVRQYVTFSGLG